MEDEEEQEEEERKVVEQSEAPPATEVEGAQSAGRTVNIEEVAGCEAETKQLEMSVNSRWKAAVYSIF